MVCFTSDLQTAAAQLMRETFEFLAVDPDFLPAGLETRFLKGARRIGWLRSPSDLQKR
jgi:hypothetical protein